jgi:hypothetical protein
MERALDAKGSGSHPVILNVPDHFRYQLVYRAERTTPFDVVQRNDVSFCFIDSVTGYYSLKHLRQALGWKEWAKGLARIAKGRMFYCAMRDSMLLHFGWVTKSFCRYYKVEQGSVVIGPIWSNPEIRGQGIATHSTMAAMNEIMQRGTSIFYIDTTDDNISCRRMIAKCGYKDPLASYIR